MLYQAESDQNLLIPILLKRAAKSHQRDDIIIREKKSTVAIMKTQDYIKETDRQLNNTNFYKQLIQTMCLPVDHQLQISVNMPKSYAKEQQICKQD